MARLLDRVRNLFDDHQEARLGTVRQQTAEQVRDQLLGQALLLKQSWTDELTRSLTDGDRASISTNFRARLETINVALDAVRQIHPAIGARIDVDHFQGLAARPSSEFKGGQPDREYENSREYVEFVRARSSEEKRTEMLAEFKAAWRDYLVFSNRDPEGIRQTLIIRDEHSDLSLREVREAEIKVNRAVEFVKFLRADPEYDPGQHSGFHPDEQRFVDLYLGMEQASTPIELSAAIAAMAKHRAGLDSATDYYNGDMKQLRDLETRAINVAEDRLAGIRVAHQAPNYAAAWAKIRAELAEQKHGLETQDSTHGESKIMEETQKNDRTIGSVLDARRAEIDREWRDVVAFSTVEAAAALNYWRGRGEEYNATREAIIHSHPHLVKDLPPAIQVDEIQVRQQVLEHEREESKSLAIAV